MSERKASQTVSRAALTLGSAVAIVGLTAAIPAHAANGGSCCGAKSSKMSHSSGMSEAAGSMSHSSGMSNTSGSMSASSGNMSGSANASGNMTNKSKSQ